MRWRLRIAFARSALLAGGLAALVPDAARSAETVSFGAYLAAAEAHSLDLKAQQENVVAARAGISIAALRPDPQFTGGIASKELARAQKPSTATASTAGLAFTIETAGKRDARVRNAERGVDAALAGVEAFRDQLQTDAASAFVEACRAHAALEREESSAAAFRATVKANETRLRVGDIGRLELRQSRVEAERFEVDVTSARAALEVAAQALSGPLGVAFPTLFGDGAPACEHAPPAAPPAASDELLAEALAHRRDVLLADATVENARSGLDLAQRNRWVDPVVNVGLTNTPRIPPVYGAGGAVVNSPAEHSLALGLTVTVPIPLSRLQDGERRQASSALAQAEAQRDATLLRARVDVQSTLALYRAAHANAERYRTSVLPDTDQVLEGMRFSYRRGAASLLELLNAQRVADEAHLAYLQAVADLDNAAVRLQLSVGRKAAL